MDDIVQSDSERLAKSRAAPLLYVVDGDANVLFASDGDRGPELPPDVVEAVRAAVRLTPNDDPRPLLHNGRLVRSERLAGADGSHCFAVFFEQISVSDGDIEDASAPETEARRTLG